MPLKRKITMALRVGTISITTGVGMAAAIVGSIIGAGGGDFWPWAYVSFTMYGLELLYASIAAIRYMRSPHYQRRRDLQQRRAALRKSKADRLPT